MQTEYVLNDSELADSNRKKEHYICLFGNCLFSSFERQK